LRGLLGLPILGPPNTNTLKKLTLLFPILFSVFPGYGQTTQNQHSGWALYTDSISGFSISLPEVPTVKRQEVPTPQLEGAKTQQKLAIATDAAAGINYILLTSDMPLGYFVEDKEVAFNDVLQRLSGQGSDFSEALTIYEEGIEGRYFTGLLKNITYVRGWYFIRGNRSFMFLQQGPNKEPIGDDFFIESLQFLPIKAATLVPDTLSNYALKRFGKFKVSHEDGYAYVAKSTNLMAQNPNSCGSYLAELAELSPYFNVLSLDTFYSNYTNALVGWTDSLITDEAITVDGKPGREAWIYSNSNKSTSRLRFWIDNSNLVSIYAFCSAEEHRSATQEAFFTSFKRLPNAPLFDIYASKAERLLDNLASSDTATQKAALRALDFYEFDSTEVGLLHSAAQKNWPDDTTTAGTRGQLINHIEVLGRSESIPALSAIYMDETVPNTLRNHALAAIQSLGDSAILAYNELFLSNPPNSTGYYYQYFAPYFDSLPFAASQFERMLPLLQDEDLSAGVLDVADRLMTKDSAQYYPLVFDAMPKLTANAVAEATMQRDSSLSGSYYSASLYQYLALLNHFPNYAVISPFTTVLMDTINDSYTIASAIGLRLKSNLAVPKASLDHCFNDKYSRYQTMKNCYETGNEKLIPKAYKTAEGIAHTLFAEFFGYDEEYPDAVKTIGTLVVDGKTYYALQAEYEWDDSFNYFGVCGPIDKKNPLAALINAKCDSAWDETSKDWKAQAELLIATLEENGWPWEE
jgi:hypothetical protein